MELRQLVSFYHVARLRSVSKAARTLELGQPTVTTHLRKLEDEFEITLFDRIKRPIQLTSEGSTLLELVIPVVQAVDTLKTQMDYSETRGSFVVGAYPDLVLHHLPPGIQAFSKQYPDVRIQLMARPYTPLMRLLKSGEVDLAFCAPPPADDPTLEFRELFRYDVVLMTPPGHPLLEQDPISLQDLAPWPLILSGPESLTRQKVEQELRNRGATCDVVLSLDDTESIKRYVETGMGVAVCNDFTLHHEDHNRLGVVRLDHIFESSVIGICTLKGKFMGQAVRNFIDVLSEEMRGFHADLAGWDHPKVNGRSTS
ncbi:MAG: LysR family transcriptional regulator, partial [SAR202 cluster bacterium]|nr:LysR family transcriptional regulator [SAR202 cluster bacterium]